LLCGLNLIVLMAITITAGLAYAYWKYSFEMRFSRSKPALEAFAAQVMASPSESPINLPSHLGEFQTNDAERLPHGFLFFCDYGHWLDDNGIAYSTEPLPNKIAKANGNYFYDHIEGSWYTLWRDNEPQGMEH